MFFETHVILQLLDQELRVHVFINLNFIIFFLRHALNCFSICHKLLVSDLVIYIQFIIGDGNNMYDFTYVENVAHAHICAERALASEGMVAQKAAGQVAFSFCDNLL